MSEQPARIEGIHPGITIRADNSTPSADWLCACGHHERATGRPATLELLARAHIGHCPHRLKGSAA